MRGYILTYSRLRKKEGNFDRQLRDLGRRGLTCARASRSNLNRKSAFRFKATSIHEYILSFNIVLMAEPSLLTLLFGQVGFCLIVIY